MLTKVRAALAGMCALIGVAVLAGSASAATTTFEYTGDAQDWAVPYGVHSASFDLYGGEGRGFDVVGSRVRGGNGGRALATIAVTPASAIRVMVGGVGAANAGGFNGGGTAVYGGGGATDVRIGGNALTDRVLVAAGGGGGGAICIGASGSAFGGSGGGVNGGTGSDPQCGASPGSGATQSAGGSSGGSLGQGGAGVAGGSGGGGGYYGGGGGNGGPGGGGSSFGPPGYGTESAVRDGHGVAIVTYEVTQRQTLRTSAVGEGDGHVSSSPAGIDCGFEDDPDRRVCFYEFGQDEPVTVTAHPSPGTVFDQWIAGCTGSTQPTCSTTMSVLRTISARFKHGPRALSVSKSGNGSGTVASAPAGIDCGSSCSADYAYGTSVTLTATPVTGSDFTGWTGACSGVSTCSVTMDQVQAVGARFTLKKYRLALAKFENGSGTVVSNPAGIDCGPSCDYAEATFDYGTSVTLTPTGAFGSDFTDWGGICQPVDPNEDCVISMTADRYAEVEFVLQRHALDVIKTGSGSGTVTSAPGGIDCGADCTDLYDHGTLVTLTASPAEHSVFTGWSGPCSGTSATCAVTIDQAREVEAAFALEKRTLSATTAGNGSGSVSSQPAGIDCGSSCSTEFDYGTSVTLTAAPATGSTFAGWTGACTGVSTCTVTMDQARTVEATFTLQKRALTINQTGNGTGTITPAGPEHDYGTTVTLTAAPATGSTFAGWTGACTGVSTCTVTMDQAREVTARFADPRPVITKLKVTLSKRLRGATRVSVTVSEAATMRFRLTRKSTKALTFDRKLTKAGTSTFTLPAKLRKQLKRGQYDLTAVATDSAGQRSDAKRVRRTPVT